MCQRRFAGLIQFDHMTFMMQLTGYQLQQTESTITNHMHTTPFDAHTIFLPRFGWERKTPHYRPDGICRLTLC